MDPVLSTFFTVVNIPCANTYVPDYYRSQVTFNFPESRTTKPTSSFNEQKLCHENSWSVLPLISGVQYTVANCVRNPDFRRQFNDSGLNIRVSMNVKLGKCEDDVELQLG